MTDDDTDIEDEDEEEEAEPPKRRKIETQPVSIKKVYIIALTLFTRQKHLPR